MKFVCPHFLAFAVVGSRPVFMSNFETAQWAPIVERVDREKTLAEKAEDLSIRLADETLTSMLSESPRLIQAIPQELLGDAKVAIGERIFAFLKKGAPALHSLDRGHKEEVIKLTYVFAHEIAVAVCSCFEERARIIELQAKANTDALTGLPHRGAFEQRLIEEVVLADRDAPLSAMFFDLDNFKDINDSYGHPAGDEVLKKLSDLFLKGEVKNIMRQTDFVARWGGDEMVFLFPNTDEEGAIIAAHRISEAVKLERFMIRDEAGTMVMANLSASIGISSFRGRGYDPDGKEMMSRADQCLYVLKGERSDSNGIKEERRGQVAVNGRVLSHAEIQSLVERRIAEGSDQK